MPYQPFQYFVRMRAVISPVVPLIPSEYWQNNSLIKHYCLGWIAIDSSVDVIHTRVSFCLERALLESQCLCVRISDSSPLFFLPFCCCFLKNNWNNFLVDRQGSLAYCWWNSPWSAADELWDQQRKLGNPFKARVLLKEMYLLQKKQNCMGWIGGLRTRI